jgi:hypothetical protein
MKTLFLAVAIAVAAVAAVKPATNAICPVLGGPVTASSPKVVVNNQEYRVCCAGCDAQLKAAPTKYLKPDGTPKNAK